MWIGRGHRGCNTFSHENAMRSLPIYPLRIQWWTRLAPLGAIYLVKRSAGRGVVVLPRGPSTGHVLFKVLLWLGLRVERGPALGMAAIVTETGTFLTASYPEGAWNSRCTDISKTKVHRCFEESFGYPLAVDPRSPNGPFVEKSNINARHDGRIHYASVEPSEGRVYCRLINNVVGREVEDLRATIVRGKIACAYRKMRPISIRFSNENSSVTIIDVDTTFSKDEQARILRLADLIGLDFGELDILRDRDDGRIYIVDVNKTPNGPPNGIGLIDYYRAIAAISTVMLAATRQVKQ